MTEKKEATAKEEARAGTEFSEWLLAILENPDSMTFNLMRELVQKVWVEKKSARYWLNRIDDLEDAGLIPFAGKRSEIIKVERDDDNQGKNKKTHISADSITRAFVRSAREQYNLLRNDPPIRTGIYMLNKPKRVQDITARFHEDGTSILNNGYENGMTIIVTGPRGSGKTYFAVNYAMIDDLRTGMKVVGNIPLKNAKSIEDYNYSELMSTTLLEICENRLNGDFTSRLYDEVQMSQKVMRQVSNVYETQKDIWALERKFGSKTCAILQLERWIPPELRDFAEVLVHKPSVKDKSLVDIYHRGGKKVYWKGVKGPQARAKEIRRLDMVPPIIETYGFGLFRVDFDYHSFYEYITREMASPLRTWKGDETISRRQLRLVIEYLHSHQQEVRLEKEHIALAILEAKRNHPDWPLTECCAVFGKEWYPSRARYYWDKLELDFSKILDATEQETNADAATAENAT